MRQIAREKKKNKLFKTDLGVSKRFLKGRSRKGKGEISSSFSNRCAFLLKRGRKSLIFSPRACIMEASAASGFENRKSRRAGRALPPQKNGERRERPPSRRKNEEVRRSGKEARPLRAGDERKATKRRLESRRMDGRTLRAPAFAFAGKRKRLKKPPVPGKKKMEKKR